MSNCPKLGEKPAKAFLQYVVLDRGKGRYQLGKPCGKRNKFLPLQDENFYTAQQDFLTFSRIF